MMTTKQIQESIDNRQPAGPLYFGPIKVVHSLGSFWVQAVGERAAACTFHRSSLRAAEAVRRLLSSFTPEELDNPDDQECYADFPCEYLS